MKDNHDIFLSMSDAEKLSLFRTIIDVREAQTPVKKRESVSGSPAIG